MKTKAYKHFCEWMEKKGHSVSLFGPDDESDAFIAAVDNHSPDLRRDVQYLVNAFSFVIPSLKATVASHASVKSYLLILARLTEQSP